jgi:hypothetical protein
MSHDNRPAQSLPEPLPHREILLRVFLETFDLYARSVAEIAAETGISGLTIETLMVYCLALPEADELIYGFIRGDPAVFPDQVRDLLDGDTRRLELDATESRQDSPATPIAPKQGFPEHIERQPSRGSNLENFIRENRQIFRQVEDSPKSFLVRWVMLHLMERAQARERGHRVVHEFFVDHPEFRERLRAAAIKHSGWSLRRRASSPRMGL